MLERGDSVQPNESASHHGDDAHSEMVEHSPESAEEKPFPFKFKAPSGRVHRLQILASLGMAELILHVNAKMGAELEAVGGAASFEDGKLGTTGYALSYLDNEGDTVSITTDQDLFEAIMLAKKTHRDKVDLFVHHPDKPPISATVDPRPALPRLPTPPESEIRERRRYNGEGEEDEMDYGKPATRRAATTAQPKQEEQLIPGVSNDVLLPGAIVTLAVVIIGVFAISRASSR
jgi:hypothetical protein